MRPDTYGYLCTGLPRDGKVPNLLNITQLVNINSLALASLSQSSNTMYVNLPATELWSLLVRDLGKNREMLCFLLKYRSVGWKKKSSQNQYKMFTCAIPKALISC